ncbi:TetR family transcriptional regulator [Streptomyces lincolnensis]|uniref:TetR family transcriptional regulator n=1 Tax=Streptomyces lincolnensis TaxID=1915 RepID=A0A1B1M8X7_STRLN|nr:TetR/AcrR family transcriptional regulator [Streptomyces lincolnensis]ANS65081.1 TetR family transcriptional regulator [Streptomyces lincolnensis]AXG56711.1 TetR family transcriptional regulator [Streptomyces lincolnensis]QMV06868.1 TetR family transcriptional regulator [Streptomyces lincolnensis]
MAEHPTSQARRPANRGPKAAAGNRAALVAAAREIYAVHGLDAPLSMIARRAGVGQGVLYRHFPDRDAVAAAILEENVREIEQAAAVEGATLAGVLGVLTWHQVRSAAFIGLLHAEGARGRAPGAARELADRVGRTLRGCLPAGGRAGAPDARDDLMLAVAMVSGAVSGGATHEERERRALAAWRLLGITVGPVRPFEG